MPKVLLAALAAGEPRPAAPAASDFTTWLRNALQAHGAVHIPIGDHEVTGKLQTLVQNDINGESRHDSSLRPSGFADYVLEVGNGTPGPNAGRIARLKISGAGGNLGCLHMNALSHMWHLDDLIFSGGPCPAIVVDSCWDSNYTNIDILGHVTRGSDPSRTAAVIFRGGSNNIYCRGLRIEGALSGGLYTDCGPIYIVTGKIDDGFGHPQSAAAITVAATGSLVLDDFYFGGMRDQFHIDLAGNLRLGRVFLDGGTNSPAAIHDHRRWVHVNVATQPDYSSSATGPRLPALDLGQAEFRRTHASVETTTPAAIYSKIHPLRQVQNLRTLSPGEVRGNTILVASNLRAPHEDLYRNSFLVHNGRRVRRKILKSFVDGSLLLEGTQTVLLDGDWSVEYCASHETPVLHHNIALETGQTLFAVVSAKVTIGSAPTYVGLPSDPAYGTTKFKISAGQLVPPQDLAGLFLVNNVTGQPFYIQYGQDEHGFVGVIYDNRDLLGITDEFRLVAGYAPARSSSRPTLTRMRVTSSTISPDLSLSADFEIAVPTTAAFTIADPVNAAAYPGQRLSVTLVNRTRAALGEVAWAGVYKLAPWVNPTPGHSRSIDFRFNGESWVEVARTSLDVPA